MAADGNTHYECDVENDYKNFTTSEEGYIYDRKKPIPYIIGEYFRWKSYPPSYKVPLIDYKNPVLKAIATYLLPYLFYTHYKDNKYASIYNSKGFVFNDGTGLPYFGGAHREYVCTPGCAMIMFHYGAAYIITEYGSFNVDGLNNKIYDRKTYMAHLTEKFGIELAVATFPIIDLHYHAGRNYEHEDFVGKKITKHDRWLSHGGDIHHITKIGDLTLPKGVVRPLTSEHFRDDTSSIDYCHPHSFIMPEECKTYKRDRNNQLTIYLRHQELMKRAGMLIDPNFEKKVELVQIICDISYVYYDYPSVPCEETMEPSMELIRDMFKKYGTECVMNYLTELFTDNWFVKHVKYIKLTDGIISEIIASFKYEKTQFDAAVSSSSTDESS